MGVDSGFLQRRFHKMRRISGVVKKHLFLKTGCTAWSLLVIGCLAVWLAGWLALFVWRMRLRTRREPSFSAVYSRCYSSIRSLASAIVRIFLTYIYAPKGIESANIETKTAPF